MGGAQIDRFANINATVIGDYSSPKVRLPGSGGSKEIAAWANRCYIITPHQKRRFPERVQYITSPGYLTGRAEREKLGLWGGPSRVITDLCVMDFNDAGAMRILSLHPGVELQEVLDKMGFVPDMPEYPTTIPRTEPPTDEQLELLRDKIDPDHIYLK